jgi:uncharacterized protein
MRALLDANVLISYLLTPAGDSPVVRIVEAGVLGRYTLLLPDALLRELGAAVAAKPYLVAGRIGRDDMRALEKVLTSVAEVIPAIQGPIPEVTRDRSDDYLLAYAVVSEADYLVTGDRDLLTIERIESVRIVTPRDFAALLGHGD